MTRYGSVNFPCFTVSYELLRKVRTGSRNFPAACGDISVQSSRSRLTSFGSTISSSSSQSLVYFYSLFLFSSDKSCDWMDLVTYPALTTSLMFVVLMVCFLLVKLQSEDINCLNFNFGVRFAVGLLLTPDNATLSEMLDCSLPHFQPIHLVFFRPSYSILLFSLSVNTRLDIFLPHSLPLCPRITSSSSSLSW